MRPLVLLFALGCGASEPEPPPVPDEPVQPALVNGGFYSGTKGWTTTGDTDVFRVFPDRRNGLLPTLTTFNDGQGPLRGDAATGTVSQSFEVPDDAVALRFVIHGGRGRVVLLRDGEIVHRARGPSNNKRRVPVSWNLMHLRGHTVELRIEDTLDKPPWAFVSVSGFDVIRDVPCPIVNAGFTEGLYGWNLEGDAGTFTWFRDDQAGGRWSISTAGTGGKDRVDGATGRLSQQFVVPSDALALRFAVHGGSRANVSLWDGAELLYKASGSDKNAERYPKSWDLVPHRGKAVRLTIEDQVTNGPFGFIGTTGFDLITKRNGP